MLILEAVKIIKKDRCESPLLPFAYHKLMHSISNLISDYPPQWRLFPPRGFLRLREGREAVVQSVQAMRSCRRWAAGGRAASANRLPCLRASSTKERQPFGFLMLFNAFCNLKRNRWASSLAVFSWRHYIITQPVSLNQETYLVSKPGGQPVPWSAKINKFQVSSYGCPFCLYT